MVNEDLLCDFKIVNKALLTKIHSKFLEIID